MNQELLFDWWSVVIILGIVHGVIVTAGLFLNKKGRPAGTVLAWLTLVLIWHHLQSLSIYLGFFKVFPHFYGADLGSLFLVGPLFYFYISFVTSGSKARFGIWDWLHFLPFVVTIIVYPVLFQGTVEKVETITQWLTATRYDNPVLKRAFILDDVIFWLESVHMIGYLVLAILKLRKYGRVRKEYASTDHDSNYRWLVHLAVSMLVVVCVSFILQKGLYVTLKYYYRSLDYIYIIPMTLVIYSIGFFAIRRPMALGHDLDFSFKPIKYAKSSLSAEEATQYTSLVRSGMVDEKLYLNPDLKLSDLAEKLGIKPSHLSQVINEQFGQSFFDFINTQRVEEAKHILSSPDYDQDKLLKVALDCGFNNKVSFNKYFKKLTGKTPTEYRKER